MIPMLDFYRWTWPKLEAHSAEADASVLEVINRRTSGFFWSLHKSEYSKEGTCAGECSSFCCFIILCMFEFGCMTLWLYGVSKVLKENFDALKSSSFSMSILIYINIFHRWFAGSVRLWMTPFRPWRKLFGGRGQRCGQHCGAAIVAIALWHSRHSRHSWDALQGDHLKWQDFAQVVSHFNPFQLLEVPQIGGSRGYTVTMGIYFIGAESADYRRHIILSKLWGSGL